MYLKRLYSEPSGLFEDVNFKNGVNFIFGKKDKSNAPKASLNSIGKSTFLDLLDFCLLSSHIKSHNPRLFAAKEIIDAYNICLDFEINNSSYTIQRCMSEPKIIYLTENGIQEEYTLDEAKIQLSNIIFKRDEYEGVFNPKWFRMLIGFYLKIQKFKKEQFNDPIKYNKDVSEAELMIYHLYLLGLDNTLSVKNFKYLVDLKQKQPTITELKRFITEKYSITDFKETNLTINRLRLEIKKLDQLISTFKLEDQYMATETEANLLTKQIKDKWFENFSDRKKIEAYQASFDIKEQVSSTKIKNLYKEVSDKFAEYVKVTLEDAIKFRKSLSQSRRAFLSDEIGLLQKNITSREEDISDLEEKRATLFNFLSTQEAIKDLTEAFVIVSEKRNELSELEGNVKTYSDLVDEKDEIELELKTNQNSINKYIKSLDLTISSLFEKFTEIYNAIYLGSQNQAAFNIEFNSKKDKLFDIIINVPDMYGKGKNQGRTLVYDLFVLINSLNEPTFPKFLVHDGIYDGMDKAHFVSVYEFIEGLANTGVKIQYITTINEEGTLSEKFGQSDVIKPEFIEDEAILVLTPSKKLFGKNFASVTT